MVSNHRDLNQHKADSFLTILSEMKFFQSDKIVI